MEDTQDETAGQEGQNLMPIEEARTTDPIGGQPASDDSSLHPPTTDPNAKVQAAQSAAGQPIPLKPLNVELVGGIPPTSHPLATQAGTAPGKPPATITDPNPITNNHLTAGPAPTPAAAGEHIAVQTAAGTLTTAAGTAATNAPHWYAKYWHFLQGIPTDITTILTVFDRLGPKFRAATLLVLKDVMVVVVDAGEDAAAIGSKNASGAIQLSEATMQAVSTLVQDALNGEKDIVADFKELGIEVVDGELVVAGTAGTAAPTSPTLMTTADSTIAGQAAPAAVASKS